MYVHIFLNKFLLCVLHIISAYILLTFQVIAIFENKLTTCLFTRTVILSVSQMLSSAVVA